jgi:hypothetical protein
VTTEQPNLTAVLALLAQLHAYKTVGYGDAWRKRGELLSIFTNLARKYDRLVVALDDQVSSSDEALLDTAGDLCVYAGKYLTWLADCQPKEFASASGVTEPSRFSDSTGPLALEAVFAHLEDSATLPVLAAWQQVKRVFEPLEAGLLAQAGVGSATSPGWSEKTKLAWELTAAAASLTLAVSLEHPGQWVALQGQVSAMWPAGHG